MIDINKVEAVIIENATTTVKNENKTTLTRADTLRLRLDRRRRRRRGRKTLLIGDVSQSTPVTKLELITDVNSDDECLSFDDDDEANKSGGAGGDSATAAAAAASTLAPPKNDYNQHFVDTGQRPQNFIRDLGLNERFEEYPKLRELIKLKDDLISKTNVPARPMYIKSDLLAKDGDDFDLNSLLGSEFDVILIEPPLHEYQLTNNIHFNRYYTWDEIKALDIGSIASSRSFVFLWCGSADGLDKGRDCLKKWGFRRCEDICWIKTNKKTKNADKEHCLMGIKGTVKRSSDASFIHTNIDIDLIISEEPPKGVADKPEEIFHIIEHFCLGKRRLHLFGGRNTNQVRHGWLTVGPDLTDTYYDRDVFKSSFMLDPTALAGGGILTGTTERIELLRPRTPPQKQQQQQVINKQITVLSETDVQI